MTFYVSCVDDEPSNLSRTEELCAKVRSDITARAEWLRRQDTWYRMRHDGLRRLHKPWPNAADMHFPLVDTTIGQFIPFYFGQLFTTDTVAQFTPLVPELAGYGSDCAYFFDYKLRQKSNLETQSLVTIDKMLMTGAAPMKAYWDFEAGRLAFDAIEPTHCIAPDQTQDLQSADRVTIVHHLSPDALRRDPHFKLKLAEYEAEEPGFITRIKGRGTDQDGGDIQLRQTKEIREGLTHSTKESDLVIVWEVWDHTEDGWWIYWFSPLAPDYPLRTEQRNPFRHGKLPIVLFQCEIKDKGYYSSRGVPEKMAPFEASLCATWNDKRDAITLYNRPIYSSSGNMPNPGNIRLMPGQIINGISAVVNPGRPPVSFDDEMNNTRAVAERMIGVEDVGIGESNEKNSPRTATEVEQIGKQQSTGIELRSRVFRLALRELLGLAWETLVQYDADFVYFVQNEIKTLPSEAARQAAWAIEPNASSQNWNKQQTFQGMLTLKQVFGPSPAYPQGAPWINQPELDKSILELYDSRLVKRLFVDPNARHMSEYEDEVALIPALLMGGPIMPKPEQDQGARIKAIVDFIAAQHHLGRPIDPVGAMALQNRIAAHLQLLQQKNPQQAQQVQASIEQMAQNVIPMQPAGAQPKPEPVSV